MSTRSVRTHRLGAVVLLAVLVYSPSIARAQWVAQNAGTDASFRGMSVLAPGVVWISGTRGAFAWTDDSGRAWHPGHVADAGSLDFRAVHAISRDTVLLMVSAQDTARIYRTTDRGATWTVQYRDESKGAFLDGMAFFDSLHGLALGDPVGGHFALLETRDGGIHWGPIPASALPPALTGEGAFAASGTALVICGAHDAWFATGGAAVSRVFHSSNGGASWSVAETPIQAGGAPVGIFSLACRDAARLVAVGGNYAKPDATRITVAHSEDGGQTWSAAAPSAATSFMSGVAYVEATPGSRRLVAVGTEGTVFSVDGGRTWSRLDARSLNVVISDGRGSAWAAGARGAVAHLDRLDPM
ncbi:MAG: YCF48-related protein [Gemmatimonadota bacterium]|nr:YCF48-related protein [Gemmatimonadota bacterium]